MTRSKLLGFALTLLVGTAGATLATFAHWPLPWMIGSLLMVALVRSVQSKNHLPAVPGSRKLGQWIIGVGIGLHFNRYVIVQIGEHLGIILTAAAVTIMAAAVAVWWMRKGGEDGATAFFASMPGGSAEMVNLGARNGALLHRVAAAQTLRVVLVVLTIPALFKLLYGQADLAATTDGVVHPLWLAAMLLLGGGLALLLQWRRKPNPWLFGPLFVSAALCSMADLNLSLPNGASEFGQLMIGSSLGCYFDRTFFKGASRFMMRSMSSTVLMSATAMAFAAGLGWLAGADYRSLTLGMMLGGIAEMSLTAEMLKLAVPLVTAMQTLRLLVVMTFAEPVYRWLDDRGRNSA